MIHKPIPSLLATLLERLDGEEALELEFKAARKALPKDVWPTVSAFSNTNGGWIILGVSEEEDTFTIQGVTNASEILKTFYDLIRDSHKISYPVCGADDSAIETLGGRKIIVLRIPAASRKVRPIYINGNPYTGTFVRRHSGDYRCNKQEVDRMMREASDVATDSTVLSHFDWDDLDHDALARYRRRYQTLHPEVPWNHYDDQRFLQAVGGFRRDKESGQQGITVAGLLLVGRPEAIREWRTRHLIDFRLAPATSGYDNRWDDRVVWEGNLLGAFEAIYPRLIADQPTPFRLEGGTRIDESPIHVVLREALVNLLVHADYAETQASLIVRSLEEYSFRNPGSSRVQEADLLTGDRSDPRNPELVRMFRLIGLAEEAGTGIPKIISAWRDLGFQLPKIDVGTERYEFSLVLRYAHLLSEDDRTWLHSLGENWTEAEQLALVLARHEGYVDNMTLRHLTGQHSADASKTLRGLRSRMLLQMIGGGRGAYYELGSTASPSVEEAPTQLSFINTESSSATSVVNSVGNRSNSEGSGPNSKGNRPSSANVHKDLEEISRVARERRRLDPVIRDSILVELCARTPLSLEQLARLMGRSEAWVREAIRPLISSGHLAYLYPNRPTHPKQKYVSGRLGSGPAQASTESPS